MTDRQQIPELPNGPPASGSSAATEDRTTPDPTAKHVGTGGRPLPRIGEYQIVRKIGGGGMGVVYEALHSRLKRRVALKLISESHFSDPAALRRFFREMESAGKLEHPHIVQATDAGVAEGVPYLVMEFVQGADLCRIVRRFGALPPLAALEAVEQTAEALGHIHAHGLVHRDVKPSNLLLTEGGLVKIADLGLAQLLQPLSEADEITTTGEVLGTVDYMAPEQAQNPRLADHRSDLYSLGCCLHFLICGSPVYGGGSRVDRLIAHRTAEIPDLVRDSGLPLPRSIDRLFRDSLAKDPQRRPKSVREVLERLRECRAEMADLIAERGSDFIAAGRLLPADVGLEMTASVIFAGGLPPPGAASQRTTVIDRARPRKRRGSAMLAAALALLTVFGGLWLHNQWRPGVQDRVPNDVAAGITGASAAPAAGQKKLPVLRGHTGAVFNVHFAEDGQRILSCGSDGTVRVWDARSGELLQTMRHERYPDGHSSGLMRHDVLDVALIDGTPLAVSTCFSGVASVWDWARGGLVRTLEGHTSRIESVAWLGGTRVLTAGENDLMFIWDAMTGDALSTLQNAHRGPVRVLAVNGGRVVSADYEGNAFLWDIERDGDKLVRQLGSFGPATQFWCADWVPGTDQVVLGGGILLSPPRSLLITYDVEEGRVVRELQGHTSRVNAVRVSRDGFRAYSAGDNVRAWSLETGELLQEFNGHEGEVFGVDESPDAALLVTGGTDGTVRFCRVRAGN